LENVYEWKENVDKRVEWGVKDVILSRGKISYFGKVEVD
jgi:hypothetical protein